MVEINTRYKLYMIDLKFALFQDGMWEFDLFIYVFTFLREQAVLLLTV